MNKITNKIVFIIQDEKGFVWGMANTKVQARRQIAWFLPRNMKMYIVPQVIPCDKDKENTA